MCIVIELQKTGDQLGNLVTTHATLAEAEAKYHAVLAAAWANEIALQEGKEMNIDFESVEIGTVEQGKIDRRYFAHVRPTPEEAVTEEA